MSFERRTAVFVTAFAVYVLGGVGPALVAHHHGHEWLLVTWAIPVVLVGVAGVVAGLCVLWTET